MSEQSSGFLTEGLRLYPEAWRTVRAFQSQVEEILRSAIEGQTWTKFHPGGQNAVVTSRSNLSGDQAPWIVAEIRGTIAGREADIETGLWWNPTEFKQPLVTYANFYKKPAELLAFTFRRESSRVQATQIGGKTRLYLPADEQRDLRADVNLLLDELQRHITE